MIAMHYVIDLPADYDMEIIRRRVRDNGKKTDGFRDLEMKAYLIAEKGKYGNAVNRYAPFYVWRAVAGMNDFLLHGPFDNILNSFGMPPVSTWFVIHPVIRKTEAPSVAGVEFEAIPPFADFKALVKREVDAAAGLAESASLVSAYNPGNWEMCRFRMSSSPDEMGRTGPVYDVHHVS